MKNELVYRFVDSQDSELVVRIDSVRETDFFHNKIIFGEDERGTQVVLKFPSRQNIAIHEYRGYQLAIAAGVSTAALLGLVVDVGGNYGIALQRIYGENLYKSNREGVKYQLGSLIRTLHDNGEVVGQCKPISRYSDYEISVAKWVTQPYMTQIDVGLIVNLVGGLSRSILDYLEKLPKKVNHGDLHDDQVIVSESGMRLIDFEEWGYGSPMEDLAIYLFHSLRTKRPDRDFRDFLAGYTQEKVLTESDKLSISYLLLFNAMKILSRVADDHASLLPYAVEYLQRSVDYVESEKIWKL